jgi:hypothetical protein
MKRKLLIEEKKIKKLNGMNFKPKCNECKNGGPCWYVQHRWHSSMGGWGSSHKVNGCGLKKMTTLLKQFEQA